MRKSANNLIREAGINPDVGRKDLFIREYRRHIGDNQISRFNMIRTQMSYIGIQVWIMSIITLIAVVLAIYSEINRITLAAALLPFVSGVAVFETARSEIYNMAEMESATLYSLRGILFARIVSIGSIHLVLLLVLTFLAKSGSGYSYLNTAIIITVPYLISSVFGMEYEKTAFGRENSWGCLIISAIISIIAIITRNSAIELFETYNTMWYLAALVLIMLQIIEIRRVFNREEYIWS